MILEILVVWFIWYLVTTYMERRLMPPGPIPLPFIGNIPALLFSTQPLIKLTQKHGDIVTVDLAEKTVIVSAASLAREARVINKDDVVGLSFTSVYPLNIIIGQNGVVFSDYGKPFLFRKRVFKLAMHVFGSGIDKAEERGSHAVKSTLEKIKSLQDQPFSPKKLIASAVLIQLWQWLTSQQISFDDSIINLLLKFSEIAEKLNISEGYIHQKIPFNSYLPTEFNRNQKRAKYIKAVIYPPVFKSHMETYTPGVIRDMTDSFISAYKKEMAKETAKDIGSIDDIQDLMLNVVFAGSDTTSSTMAWFILHMVVYPNVQGKIHEELDRVVGENASPRWQDVKNMPYLQATICEVMRRSSPVPVTGSNAMRDTTIGGFHIPKGTFVLFDWRQINNDGREWSQPDQFKPERFLDAEGNFVGWNKFNSFLPFGLGRRECAGIAFAKIMLFTFTATLLHHLRFELPEGADKPSEESYTFGDILSSPVDFKVVANKRCQK